MKCYLWTGDDKVNPWLFFRAILIAFGQVAVLVSREGDERGAPLHLVKILPLGSFHAPLADPSRKWGGVQGAPRRAPAWTTATCWAQIKGDSLSLAWGRESAVCHQRDMGNRTACHTSADACIFDSVYLTLSCLGCTLMTPSNKRLVQWGHIYINDLGNFQKRPGSHVAISVIPVKYVRSNRFKIAIIHSVAMLAVIVHVETWGLRVTVVRAI